MTREREDELLAQVREVQKETGRLIQLIVDARMRGHRDEEAIAALAVQSQRYLELTRPNFELAV